MVTSPIAIIQYIRNYHSIDYLYEIWLLPRVSHNVKSALNKGPIAYITYIFSENLRADF